jgi:site-specific DNA recombinase
LQCARCGRKLTGSASKGNGGSYFYYHCGDGCGERFKAEEANDKFKKELMKISANKNVIQLFQFILRDYSQLGEKEMTRRLGPIKAEIEKSKTRISNARLLMLDGQLDAKDYHEIKVKLEDKTRKLEAKLSEMAFISSNLNEQLDFCSQLLPNIAQYYTTADLSVKQQIIGSIFPEKLIFEKNSYRTIRVNEVVRWICRPVADFGELEKKKAPIFWSFPVLCPEQESNLHYLAITRF